jgi:hypothetical protein
MDCLVCHSDPCTCLDTLANRPVTSADWVDSLNASVQDLAYGKELEDSQIMGGAGVRYATARDALDEAGVVLRWDEGDGKWELL